MASKKKQSKAGSYRELNR